MPEPPEVPVGCNDTAAARDALGSRVDMIALAVFATVILLAVLMTLRAKRLKAARI